ncbi:MAG: hypothetical protein ACR2K4_01225 [Candidatus Limnocylindria bacterium]
MSTTIWTARVSGDRMLCGRMVAGQFACTGEIAFLAYGSGGVRRPGLRGMVEDPAGSNHWRPTVTGTEKLAAGYKRSAYKRRATTADGRRVSPVKVPAPGWTRACPHCECTNIVGEAPSAVLDSGP